MPGQKVFPASQGAGSAGRSLGSRSGSDGPRSGRVPTWIPLALLFAGLFAGLAALQGNAREFGLARVDTTRYRLQSGSQWLSPAWLEELERVLVRIREIPADDPKQIRAFVDEVRALPFVAEVGTPEVQWPDGLALPIRLYEPVACIPTGTRDYLPVAADGTVLGGYAFAPHEAYGGWLPTLGPHGAAPDVIPGDTLTLPAHLAGLEIATSMWGHLQVDDLRRLGRIFVDASRPDAPVFDRSPGSSTPRRLPGGAILALEDGRRVYFGRPPKPLFDGELPIAMKWDHIRRAVGDRIPGEAGASGQGPTEPWALLDARFDEPIYLTREEVEAFARGGSER